MKLFKYRKLNLNTITTLINKQIYFSKVNAFNDPFDGKIFIKAIESTDEAERFANIVSPGDENEIFRTGFLYKFDEHLKFRLSKGLRPSFRTPGMDPYDINMKISCFSSKWDNIQMWGHYADSHQGICLGFVCTPYLCDPTMQALKVSTKLSSRYPVVDGCSTIPILKVQYLRKPISQIDLSYPNDLIEKYRQILGSKELHWKYESEWRAFLDLDMNLVEFDISQLSDVLFGCKTSEIDKKTVIKIVKGHEGSEKVKFWSLLQSESEYRLLRMRIPSN